MSERARIAPPSSDRDHDRRPGPARPRGVLDGAFALLEVMSQAPRLGLSEIARAAGVPKATTHRMLEHLVALGMVARDGRDYRLGAGLLRLARPDRPYQRMRQVAHGPLTALAAATAATMTLNVLGDDGLLVVSAAHGARAVRIPPGVTLPLATAAGQILLAERPDGYGSAVEDGATRGGVMGAGGSVGLRGVGGEPLQRERRVHWAEIHRRGVAYDRQDVTAGVCCAAVPVRAGDGTVVAALSALLVTDRLPHALPDVLRRGARDIERALARPGFTR